MRSFDESLPMALLSAREATMRAFRPLLARYDLTEQQWRVLRALSPVPGGLDIGEIADLTLLLGPSLSRIVANLADRGLVERAPSAADQRRVIVTLTDLGRGLVVAVGPSSEAIYDQIEHHVGPDQLATLLGLLRQLGRLEPNRCELDHQEAAAQ